MRARTLAFVTALALVAPAGAYAQRSHATSRDGARSSDRGGGHSRSRPTAAPRRTAPRPPTTAERRHPRAGTGTGYYQSRHGYYGYRPYYRYPGYYYGGYWGYPYYYAPGWGFYGYYGYGWPYGGVSVSYARGYDDTGALRLIVQPVETEVYVDGYYAGVVDDFDGIFQRLRLPPGRHEIRLQLDGYKTQTLRVAVQPDHTIKVHWKMVRGAGEAPAEELPGYAEAAPAPAPPPQSSGAPPPAAPPQQGYDEGQAPAWVTTIPRDAARVHLEVTPADASVYVDGEFRGLAADVGTLVLSPGKHRLEIVRPGRRTFQEDLELRRGDERSVSVRLDPVA